MSLLKHSAKIIIEVTNAIQNLSTLVDSVKALTDRLPNLPPDFWH